MGYGVVGYVVVEVDIRYLPFEMRTEKRGHVLNLAVDPRFRRRGLATKLMEHGLAWLRQQGMSEVWLEVRVSNKAARLLYQKLGFSEMRRLWRYYGDEDAVVMARRL